MGFGRRLLSVLPLLLVLVSSSPASRAKLRLGTLDEKALYGRHLTAETSLNYISVGGHRFYVATNLTKNAYIRDAPVQIAVASPRDACSPLEDVVTGGNVVLLVDSSASCAFKEKVDHARDAGAAAGPCTVDRGTARPACAHSPTQYDQGP